MNVFPVLDCISSKAPVDELLSDLWSCVAAGELKCIKYIHPCTTNNMYPNILAKDYLGMKLQNLLGIPDGIGLQMKRFNWTKYIE